MLNVNHKGLEVYKKSMELIKHIYLLTAHFPESEKFNLVNQIRRSAISLCSNIAEGSSRKTPKERSRFYEIARSSLVELDCQLEIAMILGYLEKNKLGNVIELISVIFRMLSSMINKLA